MVNRNLITKYQKNIILYKYPDIIKIKSLIDYDGQNRSREKEINGKA